MRSLTATGAAWWGELEARERLLIAGAALLLVISVGWFLIWEPITAKSENLEADIQTTEALLTQLNAVAPGQKGTSQDVSGRDQSLLSLLDSTAKSSGLGDALKRIQPDGERTARIWLEAAEFDKLLRWLKQLQARYGIEVGEATISREDAAGMVRARIAFQRL